MRIVVVAGVLLLLSAGAEAQAACEYTPASLLTDTFDTLRPVWTATTDISVDDGNLAITTRPEKSEKIFAAPKFGDVDVCADVSVITTSDLGASYVGIGFWMTDPANLYTFQITPDGYAGVYRLKDDKWETLIKDKTSPSIKTGVEVTNTLRVVTIGNKATLYVNDDRFASFIGVPPTAGQKIGFVVEGPDKDPTTFHFDNINAVYPEPPSQ